MGQVKRVVTDEEYRLAYYGRKGDPSEKAAMHNRRIIHAVTSRFRRQLPEDELESCGMRGLWKALQNHDDTYQRKFTTTLWNFVKFECLHALRRNKRWLGRADLMDIPLQEQSWSVGHVTECLNLLPAEARRVLEQYYCQGLTLEQVAVRNLISVETARMRINKAVGKLREVFVEEACN